MKSNSFPEHIAIIMDGNGRWAKKRGLIRTKGHEKGVSIIEDLADYAFSRGVKYLSLFAFSTENWKRSSTEVNFLLGLLKNYIINNIARIKDKNIRLKVIGEREGLSPSLLKQIVQIETMSKDCTKGTICICFNYGGRAEILHAAKELSGKEITEESFKDALYFKDIPDPEIVIRTGGEHRISNFMIYEMAYSEIYFLNTLWPDFSNSDLDAVIADYMGTERRFGGVDQ